MSVKIIYPPNIKSWMRSPAGVVELLHTQAGAIKYLTSNNTGMLSSDPLPRFIIPFNTPQELNTGDFNKIVITVTSDNSAKPYALELEKIITKWATFSEVPGRKGERIAIISNADVIATSASGTVDYIWEVAFSSFVVYSYQRATNNFPSTQLQANEDMQNLYDLIKQLSPSLNLIINTPEK